MFLIAIGLVHTPPARSMPSHARDAKLADIAANDNTVAGGTLGGGTLHIALVARRGLWYPDGPGTIGLPIEAFGEAGKPLQIPGPLFALRWGPASSRRSATISVTS